MKTSRITISLPNETEAKLKNEASIAGLSLSNYCCRLFESRRILEKAETPHTKDDTRFSGVTADTIKFKDGRTLNDYIETIVEALEDIIKAQQKIISSQNDVVIEQEKSIDELYSFFDYLDIYMNTHDPKSAAIVKKHWKKEYPDS